MQNVMIDLETLGTAEDAAIISVGACEFNPMIGEIGRKFYERIDWESAMSGRTITADTIKWWMQQEDGVRLEVLAEGKPFQAVLSDFAAWLPAGCIVWGNGATFDITLLSTAYGKDVPWGFRDVRDMRTIKALEAASQDEVDFDGVAHNALDDAVWQAKYVAIAWGRLWNGVH